MNNSMDRSVRTVRFSISDLQRRIAVLEATREDLACQMRKLNDSVPEEDVAPNAQKDGFVAYGSYAKSVLLRKKNLRNTMDDIECQNTGLNAKLCLAMETLDSFERVRARRLAMQAEKLASKRA
ncbi:MAG: hypothetical protein V3U57_09955 [Robiginitomaculum sp.]